MRPTSDVDAEAWVLTTEAGRALLDEVARVTSPGPADLARWRKGASADRVAAALRLAWSRARGASKFARADRMWLDKVGLEQATAEPVARHKARRLAGRLVVDLCAGVGGDALALAAAGARVLAVDADEGMCRRLKWNAEVYEVAGRVAPICARAERFPILEGALVHVDPDRRGISAHRARSVRDYAPSLDFLLSMVRTVAGGAIKLSPASDFETHFGEPSFEVELISLDGECKEATVWFDRLASCRRRATRLPEGVAWTDRDGSTDVSAEVSPLTFLLQLRLGF
jgi:SAM-dependent methyltransferase